MPNNNRNFDYKAMGERVHDLRRKANLTQEELAEKANISTSFVGHIERGEKKFSVATLYYLAEALGSSMDYIATGRVPLAADDKPLKEAVQAVLDSYR